MKCVKRLTADQQRLAEENLTIVERVLRFDINANPCVAGLGYEDLYQEGCVWLCNAALTFDPARGSFASYARQVVQNGLVSYCRNLTGKQSRMISLAEIEMDIRRLKDGYDVLDKLYDDNDLNCDNFAQAVREYRCSHEVITAVANLYLRQQIMIDTY